MVLIDCILNLFVDVCLLFNTYLVSNVQCILLECVLM